MIEIEIGDNMRYTPSVIDAEPGQKLRVVLKPVGKIQALGHNFVLLKPGTEAKPFVDKAAARSACCGRLACSRLSIVVRSGSTDIPVPIIL